MTVEFVKSDMAGLNVLLDEYLQTLSGVTDDYWEHHIVTATQYIINADGETAGCFAVYEGEMLTMFYVRPQYIYIAQEIFSKILTDFGIKCAYVSTADALYLALCMDFHKRIEMQAYFFDGDNSHVVRDAEFGRELLSELSVDEFDEINAKTDNFFVKKDFENPEVKLYRLSNENGEDLGYGLIVPCKLKPNQCGPGMITLPRHRGKGVGRSLQIHLADICREMGKNPVSGCWYYNELSKKTVESAGRHSRVRLLKVWFTDKEEDLK
jgi:GNAT superfamily N-acetyltransferase